jgi:uncharacterized protein (DUF302 family)
MMMRRWLAATALMTVPVLGHADGIAPRDGWQVIDTDLAYPALIDAVKAATEANGMRVVTEAGPTEAAAKLGTVIPGNRVIGVFNPTYAIRILPLSTAAMIEAPIRFYVTEDADGTATLSWKTPSHVFEPYADEGGADLAVIAAELDATFAAIAAAATTAPP